MSESLGADAAETPTDRGLTMKDFVVTFRTMEKQPMHMTYTVRADNGRMATIEARKLVRQEMTSLPCVLISIYEKDGENDQG